MCTHPHAYTHAHAGNPGAAGIDVAPLIDPPIPLHIPKLPNNDPLGATAGAAVVDIAPVAAQDAVVVRCVSVYV
jgi:hypothetical protein